MLIKLQIFKSNGRYNPMVFMRFNLISTSKGGIQSVSYSPLLQIFRAIENWNEDAGRVSSFWNSFVRKTGMYRWISSAKVGLSYTILDWTRRICSTGLHFPQTLIQILRVMHKLSHEGDWKIWGHLFSTILPWPRKHWHVTSNINYDLIDI